MLSRVRRSVPVRRFARAYHEFKEKPDFVRAVNEPRKPGEDVVIDENGRDWNLLYLDQGELLHRKLQISEEVAASSAEDDEGFLEAVGLGPFHRRASLVATGVLTALSNEFYVLNEETFVAGCLATGFTVMYVNLREPALEAYENFQKETLSAQQEAEEKHIAACHTLVRAQSGSEHIVDAVKVAFQEKEQLVHAEATAKAILEKNKVAKDFEAKLQALVNRKADEENKAYKELIDNVYAQVLESATSDAKFKKSALQYALTAITSAEKAGANPTVELYTSKLQK